MNLHYISDKSIENSILQYFDLLKIMFKGIFAKFHNPRLVVCKPNS